MNNEELVNNVVCVTKETFMTNEILVTNELFMANETYSHIHIALMIMHSNEYARQRTWKKPPNRTMQDNISIPPG